MGRPAAGNHEPFAHSRQRNGSHNGDHLSAAHIQPQHRIAVFIILIHHGADRALEDLHFLFHELQFSPFPKRDSFLPILQHFQENEKGKFRHRRKIYKKLIKIALIQRQVFRFRWWHLKGFKNETSMVQKTGPQWYGKQDLNGTANRYLIIRIIKRRNNTAKKRESGLGQQRSLSLCKKPPPLRVAVN